MSRKRAKGLNKFNRYAVYYSPEQGALTEFCAGWLGWDALRGRPVPHPGHSGLTRPLADITQTPRKYGFHATIKPPFRLAEGTTEPELISAFDQLTREMKTVRLDGLELKNIGRFLALSALGDTSALSELAASYVRSLDRFRAPLTEEELARRNPDRLRPILRDLLMQWGYPYVMEAFKFHMTLTGRLSKEDIEATANVMRPLLEQLLPSPFIIDSMCLFGEAEDGNFRLIHRAYLVK